MIDLPPTVQAALDRDQAPTPPLADYLKAMEKDDNLPWRLGAGHVLNLLEEAVDRIEDLEGQLQAVTAKVR